MLQESACAETLGTSDRQNDRWGLRRYPLIPVMKSAANRKGDQPLCHAPRRVRPRRRTAATGSSLLPVAVLAITALAITAEMSYPQLLDYASIPVMETQRVNGYFFHKGSQ